MDPVEQDSSSNGVNQPKTRFAKHWSEKAKAAAKLIRKRTIPSEEEAEREMKNAVKRACTDPPPGGKGKGKARHSQESNTTTLSQKHVSPQHRCLRILLTAVHNIEYQWYQ
jgi:hypothetical protein